VYIVTIPTELKKDQLDENIRIYGSADKIPDDKKEKDTVSMLTSVAGGSRGDYDSDKDITFNDRPAHLAESIVGDTSFGRIAILLDENTIGIIDVRIDRSPLSGGATFFDGKAWDIIDSITVK